MKKVLVLGGTGFIGKHLVKRLEGMPGVSVETGSLRTYWLEAQGAKTLNFHPSGYDVVYHLAANPSVASSGFFENAELVERVLRNCRDGVRFVYASSATVYGDGYAWPSAEFHVTSPTSLYGASKVAGEALVQAYTALGVISGISLRLVANVGTGSTHGLLHDVVRKLRSDEECLNLLGAVPGSTKPYCHVSDTVEAMILAGFEDRWKGVSAVNVGPMTELSVLGLATLAQDKLGTSKPIFWMGEGANWKGDNRRVRISNVLAEEKGWIPEFPTSEEAVLKACEEIASETQ